MSDAKNCSLLLPSLSTLKRPPHEPFGKHAQLPGASCKGGHPGILTLLLEKTVKRIEGHAFQIASYLYLRS